MFEHETYSQLLDFSVLQNFIKTKNIDVFSNILSTSQTHLHYLIIVASLRLPNANINLLTK